LIIHVTYYKKQLGLLLDSLINWKVNQNVFIITTAI